MHLIFGVMNFPLLVNLGTNFIKVALVLRLPIKPLIKGTIFKQFCGGESIEDCRDKSLELDRYGIDTILDYSVEGTENESDFERITKEILNTIDKAGIPPQNPFVVLKISGIGSNDLLAKIHKNQSLSEDEKDAWKRIRKRLDLICQHAYDRALKVLIDAEESWFQAPIDTLVYEMMHKYNSHKPVIYNTFQMYRKNMYQNLEHALEEAKRQNFYLGVKLVRGAYMEKERERAESHGYEDPIQENKQTVDRYFNLALKFCIENLDRIGLCCGSHNEYSNMHLTNLMESYQIAPNDPRVYFVQLYGMSDNISFNLSNAGFNVAKYLPYGPVNDVIPYLIRRAEENTAIAGQSSREFVLIKKERARRRSAKSSS